MPANVANPFYAPAEKLTGQASAAVVGKRFVNISGNRTADGNILVALAAAGAIAVGVSEYDAAIGEKLGIFSLESGFVVPVTAGGVLTAGQSVTSDTTGQAVAVAGAGGTLQPALGVVLTAAANGAEAMILLSRHTRLM